MLEKPIRFTANLRAAFSGLRFLPPIIGFATNNLNPKLILHENEIEYKVILKTRLAYTDVELIEVFFLGDTTNNLTIRPKTGLCIFTANFQSKSQLYQFLKILADKGCPLSPKTQQLVEQYDKSRGQQP